MEWHFIIASRTSRVRLTQFESKIERAARKARNPDLNCSVCTTSGMYAVDDDTDDDGDDDDDDGGGDDGDDAESPSV